MNIITEIISTIGAWVTGFVGTVLDVFNGLIPLFWDGTTGLTVFGVLGLMGIAVGLVKLGLNFVKKMFMK